ncbi:putative alcohol dehydrogenase [Hypoxylon trugodes]|uniref:putative alcohol dehydrogenase n=1 Tax=Hypoxylon trugodes TaxID=326681 RepID=UPI002196E1DF|nr:putative alcohol dehydrogenase [Hypoxylon trugodes]KAI1393286.1 putative alcohol dehydrogenase [Hypoxylon trugodes]
MSLPKTYKRAVFITKGQPLVVEETPLVLPGDEEILVKVEACGVCYSDVFPQHNIMGGGFPLCPGHEIIGKVAAVGGGVKAWKVGDRVGAGWHGGHDGTCTACRKGWYQMCDNQVVNGVTKNGGYAEYCILRPESTVRVPEHVDAVKYAPILCAGMTVYNSMRHMNIPVGETIAVQGLGGLGHLAIQYAARMGYRVIAISRGADKEKFARELGAHEYIDASKSEDVGDALKALGSASLVVTTAPTADSMTPLLKGLGVLGKLLVLSVPGDLTVNTGVMLKYGVSVQIWPCGHARDAEETIAFTELQSIDCMVQKFPLDQAQAAFDAMLNGTVRFRSVIVP